MRRILLSVSFCLAAALSCLVGCKQDSSTPTVTPGKAGEVLQRDAKIPGSDETPARQKPEDATGGRETKSSGRPMDRELPK